MLKISKSNHYTTAGPGSILLYEESQSLIFCGNPLSPKGPPFDK